MEAMVLKEVWPLRQAMQFFFLRCVQADKFQLSKNTNFFTWKWITVIFVQILRNKHKWYFIIITLLLLHCQSCKCNNEFLTINMFENNVSSATFLSHVTRLYTPLWPSVHESVPILLFWRFWALWAHCSCPNAPVTFSITVPANLHPTKVTMYPALMRQQVPTTISGICEFFSNVFFRFWSL